ncbi:MAG: hypothetical protein AB7O65_08685 [Candidatus Korobacteraceae bacterium]
MKTTTWSNQAIDFERIGLEAAQLTRDIERAKEIAALEIFAYEQTLRGAVEKLEDHIRECEGRMHALCSQLYDSEPPVSDKTMLAWRFRLKAFVALLVGLLFASIAAHTYRFILFGQNLLAAGGLGILFTGAVLAVGHFLYEKLLFRYRSLQIVMVGASALLLLGGSLDLAQAGGIAVRARETSNEVTASYVAGVDQEAPVNEASVRSDEQNANALFSSAVTKIFLSIDLVLGLLLGTTLQMRGDKNYVSWNKVHRYKSEIAEMRAELTLLLSSVEVAKRKCMAGILRYFHAYRKRHVPYLAGFLVVFSVLNAHAQRSTRQEAILIDVSGSIGNGTKSDIFQEYLVGAKRLLITEPPEGRVVVSTITTDSFGSGREIVKGWTPQASGVFTERLTRAQRQLASALESKMATLSPSSSGTDIFGALFWSKTMLEGTRQSGNSREIWIFSDMMNESATLNMPALLSAGPEQMIEQARKTESLVKLPGYKIHVIGASTRGLSPKAWSTLKQFWTLYFQQAGADLISYSPEVAPDRGN